MTTLNSERFVREAIESILGQTLPDWEMIIVDGGSTDSTTDIIRSCKDRRIRLLERKGMRRSGQLNVGIKKAVGDFIAIMDSDDIAMPTRLEEQLHFLGSSRSVTLLGTSAILIGERKERLGYLQRPVLHEQVMRHLLNGGAPSFGTTMGRRSVYAGEPFDERIANNVDADWYVRNSWKIRFGNLDRPLMMLRQTSRSLSRGSRFPETSMRLAGNVEQFVVEKMHSKRSEGEQIHLLRLAGIAHYYFGSPVKARQFLLRAFRLDRFDFLTLRFLAPLVFVPNAVLKQLGKSRKLQWLRGLVRRAVTQF